MIPIHLTFLCFIDYNVYGLEIMVFVVDFVLLWMNFVNYMTLNKILIGIQAGIMFLSSFVALTHFQRVFLSGELEWHIIVCYIVQFLLLYPIAAIILLRRLKDHYNQ